MTRRMITIGVAALLVATSSAAQANLVGPYDLGGAKPYALLQLGNDGGDTTSMASGSSRIFRVLIVSVSICV